MILNQDKLTPQDKLFILVNKSQFNTSIKTSLYMHQDDWKLDIQEMVSPEEQEIIENQRNKLIKKFDSIINAFPGTVDDDREKQSLFTLYKKFFIALVRHPSDFYSYIHNFLTIVNCFFAYETKSHRHIYKENAQLMNALRDQMEFFFKDLLPYKARVCDFYQLMTNEYEERINTYYFLFKQYGKSIARLINQKHIVINNDMPTFLACVYQTYITMFDTSDHYDEYCGDIVYAVSALSDEFVKYYENHDVYEVLKKLYYGEFLSYAFYETTDSLEDEIPMYNVQFNTSINEETINMTYDRSTSVVGQNIFESTSERDISYYIRNDILPITKEEVEHYTHIENSDFLLTENQLGYLKFHTVPFLKIKNKDQSRVIGRYNGENYILFKGNDNKKIYGLSIESYFDKNGIKSKKFLSLFLPNDKTYKMKI